MCAVSATDDYWLDQLPLKPCVWGGIPASTTVVSDPNAARAPESDKERQDRLWRAVCDASQS